MPTAFLDVCQLPSPRSLQARRRGELHTNRSILKDGSAPETMTAIIREDADWLKPTRPSSPISECAIWKICPFCTRNTLSPPYATSAVKTTSPPF
jgi:hypothetical protein